MEGWRESIGRSERERGGKSYMCMYTSSTRQEHPCCSHGVVIPANDCLVLKETDNSGCHDPHGK